MRKAENSFVYFIRLGSNGPIKIGFTRDPGQRLRQLQTSTPEQLIMVECVRGTRDLERGLHDVFSDMRLSGEWFLVNEDLLELLNSDAIKSASIANSAPVSTT